MGITLTLPQLGGRRTTKDLVIMVLGEHWPLTAKRIFNILKKQYSYGKTYQSVFKALKELVDDGVCKEKNGEYLINLTWINDVHRLTEQIRSNYSTKERLSTTQGVISSKVAEDITIITFETLFDAEKYLYYFEKNYLRGKKKVTICRRISHDWKALFYLRAEYNRITSLKKDGAELYVLTAGKSFLDRWVAKFYRSLGMHVKTGVRTDVELEVIGDYFIQIFIPEEIRKGIESVFGYAQSLNEFNAAALIQNVLEKKTQIQVIINKNAHVAADMQRQIMRQFSK